MTAALHADLVKEAREIAKAFRTLPQYQSSASTLDCMADAIESLERQLARSDAVVHDYDNGRVCDLYFATADERLVAKREAIARHRERMKEGKE